MCMTIMASFSNGAVTSAKINSVPEHSTHLAGSASPGHGLQVIGGSLPFPQPRLYVVQKLRESRPRYAAAFRSSCLFVEAVA